MTKPTHSEISDELWDKVINDQQIRKAVVYESHQFLFHIYFPHYVKFRSAPLHKELFAITEDEGTELAVIVAFRGSAKSTIMTLSYPIWAIVGKLQKKYVLIVAETQEQAKQHLRNIKSELERNELLRMDLGPFEEPDDEWRQSTLVLPKYNARIMAISRDQSMRGLRHGSHRPDLIIADDVESPASTKTRESRNNIFGWFTGEILPAGDQRTKTVVIGNLVHEDSLIMRLKANIEEKRMNGIFRSYPIVNDKSEIAWPGKFITLAAIESERKKIGNEIAWQREYMLRIVPDEEQVIHKEHIRHYTDLPKEINHRLCVFIGVDPAISQKDSACNTAVVSMVIYSTPDGLKMYVLPHPVNGKLTHAETLRELVNLYQFWARQTRTEILVEDVASQRILVETLNNNNCYARGIPPYGDKRARLVSMSPYIHNGNILFPESGCDELIAQLIGFGVERYDDLVDALTICLPAIVENDFQNRNFEVVRIC